MLISGDLFDGAERSARTAAFLTGQFDRLREAGIRVFYVKGNHDADNPIAGKIDLPDNVHVFDGRGGKIQLAEDIWIHGVSFTGRRAEKSLLPRFSGPIAGATNIAMLHTSLAGAEGHDPYAPCSVGDLKSSGFDYWALGHVHRRQLHSENPWIVMPGTPQGRDIGESGPKSATLLMIDGSIQIEEVPTSVTEFAEIEVDATGLDDDDSLRDQLRRQMRGAVENLVSDTGVIRLKIAGNTQRRWQILRDKDVWSETSERIARETGRLWLERLALEIADESPSGQGPTDELAGIMEDIQAESGFASDCRTETDTILAEVPARRRASLAPDEESLSILAKNLSESGAQRVLARMKGAES